MEAITTPMATDPPTTIPVVGTLHTNRRRRCLQEVAVGSSLTGGNWVLSLVSRASINVCVGIRHLYAQLVEENEAILKYKKKVLQKLSFCHLKVGGRTGGVGEWETTFAYCTQLFEEGAFQVTNTWTFHYS